MQVLRNEARTRSLDLMGTRLQGLAGEALGNDRRILGLDGNGLEGGFSLLDDLTTAGNGTARTEG